MRPLEERFPTLYYNIVNERSTTGTVAEKRTEKENAPTLFDVVQAVCSSHRVSDVGFMKDLTSAVIEFTTPPKPAEKKEEGKKKGNKESE